MSKKLIFIFLLLIIAILVVSKNQSSSQPQPTPTPVPTPSASTISTEAAIAAAFSRKYNRPVDDFIVDVDTDTGTFAKGSIRFKDELGGGLWFGANTSAGWELAADGQGPMSCEVAEKYDFPRDMVPGCIDTANSNTFVER